MASFGAFSQFTDDFEDADISDWTQNNPGRWEASSDAPLNGTYSLRHVFDNPDSDFDCISHPFGSISLDAGTTTWQFRVKHGYDPSSGNNWAFFLMSDNDAPEMHPSGSADGYAIGVNYSGSDDILKIWKISAGGGSEILNTGLNWQDEIGTTAQIGIKVTRSASGEWAVFTDNDGGFDNLTQQGTSVTDNSYNQASHCGLYYEYTSSQDQKIYLDDVSLEGTVITASELQISEQPQAVQIGSNFALTVNATDSEGNIDTDYSGTVSISLASGSGNISAAGGLSKTMENGTVTWNDLQYDTEESFSLSVSSAGLSDAVSQSIDALDISVYLDDDFEDGNLLNWTESTSGHWAASDNEPLNGSYSLKHIFDASESGTSVITHPLEAVSFDNGEKVWRFTLKYPNASPSGNNNWSVFLFSDADHSQMTPGGAINGYNFGINFDDTDDIVKLKKLTNGTAETVITTSMDWNTINSDLPVSFEIIRTPAGEWEIKADTDGGFDALQSIGTGTDAEHTQADYFGIYYLYSSTMDQMLRIDDVYFGIPIPDETPASLSEMTVVSPNQIQLVFTEKISSASAENTANYIVNNGIGNPQSANQDASDSQIVLLSFAQNFQTDTDYQLTIQNISDLSGNISPDFAENFTWINPMIENLTPVSETELVLNFSKAPESTSALVPSNYTVNNGIGGAAAAEFLDAENTSLKLTFETPFVLEETYVLSISNIEDEYGNLFQPESYEFMYYSPQAFDIVINEIMCDISPMPEALPAYEYVEIYNNSAYELNLAEWTFTIGDNSPRVLPSVNIEPGEYAIICSEEAVSDMQMFGKTIAVLSESQLTTTGKRLVLAKPDGTIIEDIEYDKTWYNDTEKDNGGWSMERIDPQNFCGKQNNWAATVNPVGGTPGRLNSVFAINPDEAAPEVSDLIYQNSRHLTAVFSENIEINSAEDITNYFLNENTNPLSVVLSSEERNKADLYFENDFPIGENTLSISGISDNCENIISETELNFTYQLIYPEEVVVINNTQLNLYFSEKVDLQTAQNTDNYFVNNGIGTPFLSTINNSDSSIVSLQFNQEFELGSFNTLTVSNISDRNGNIMQTKNLDFAYYIAQEFDIVFNEMMSDINPAPPALPEVEYIELKNISAYTLNLESWIFAPEGQSGKELPAISLEAGEYLIICESNEAEQFRDYGKVVDIMSSSDLSSTGKKLQLFSAEGKLIDAVSYTKAWYDNEDVEDGGFSLERIDASNFCGDDENWNASEDISGGTPGKANSIAAENPYDSSPEVDSVSVVSAVRLTVYFSEAVNKQSSENIENYLVNQSIGAPDTAYRYDEDANIVGLEFAEQFQDAANYELSLSPIFNDCGFSSNETVIEFDYKRIAPLRLWVLAQNRLKIKYSEAVDLSSGTASGNYNASAGVGAPESIVRDSKDSSVVFLQFENLFPSGEEVVLSISGVQDQNGNTAEDAEMNFLFYIPKEKDLVINEVLFDPHTDGNDFVEIYNCSGVSIDLKDIALATRDKETDSISDLSPLANENFLIEAEDYMAFTDSKDGVMRFYISQNEGGIIEVSDLPTYSNESGKVLLVYADTLILDEFEYREDMHFELLDDTEGVSLERINYDASSQEENNWHSASEFSGFATPAYKNSQFREIPDAGDAEVFVEPEVFSPDNDGMDDFAEIRYRFDEAGYVANVFIYDAYGRMIEQLGNNVLLSREGKLQWDGIFETGEKAPVGIYVILFEAFDLNGNKKVFKRTVTLAAKF